MVALRAAGLGALLGLAAGFAAGTAWTSRGAEQPPSPAPAGREATEPEPILALREENAQLTGEIARLEAALEEGRSAEGPAETPDETPDAEASRDAAQAAAGWLPAEIDRLREEVEAYQLERLYLRDQAEREGWRGEGRFRREQLRLLAELRRRLGDEDYEAALYAAGRSNRVEVQSLLEGSPAGEAGLREGDEILRYAGERIFDASRLVRLTAAGEAGRPVEMRVLRGDEELRLFVPRGPLGARMQAVSSPPFGRS